MKLMCYNIAGQPVEIAPGKPDRDWMNEYSGRQPYRCLPLVIANSSGWELLTPFPFKATWNGGPAAEDITIEYPFNMSPKMGRGYVLSHFSRGVITFQPGYLFRTPPGWDLWVGGAPNVIKHGIQPLVGIVETSWLPFPFTMNWRFTAPGTISFAKGEPFAMLMPVPHSAIDDVQPVVKSIKDEPEIEAQLTAWQTSRGEFLRKLTEMRPETLARSWQRHYFKGEDSSGQPISEDHIHRRRLKNPRPAEPGE